jgi:hypothetical protein
LRKRIALTSGPRQGSQRGLNGGVSRFMSKSLLGDRGWTRNARVARFQKLLTVPGIHEANVRVLLFDPPWSRSMMNWDSGDADLQRGCRRRLPPRLRVRKDPYPDIPHSPSQRLGRCPRHPAGAERPPTAARWSNSRALFRSSLYQSELSKGWSHHAKALR